MFTGVEPFNLISGKYGSVTVTFLYTVAERLEVLVAVYDIVCVPTTLVSN